MNKESFRTQVKQVKKGRVSRGVLTIVSPSRAAAAAAHRRRKHRLARWPWWASRWLGYRASPPPPLPKPLVWFWTLIGAFCGVSVIQALFNYSDYFIRRGVPGIIASYGASAVLVYGAIDSPLAQPRALVCGHFLSALTGVCVAKLFETMHDKPHLEEVRWLAGSVAASAAVVVMQITETTHPPAGATALLAAVNQPVYELGWYYLPIILLSSSLMLTVALIINNIQRRYPVFWFKPIVEPSAPVEPALGGPETDGDDDDDDVDEGEEGDEEAALPESGASSPSTSPSRTASVRSVSRIRASEDMAMKEKRDTSRGGAPTTEEVRGRREERDVGEMV
ncbi:hypothetical protein EIP91_003841 [Steccherinum ochraceum]|uniref:HPP transmembrane region domain-containing protein n=1 Tax=Steccherinum ochraceum TaxID=92696 RepID=A0A4R0RIB0_9APHY|nr:hypothetical protein EIP91_003841 [Steccherinum ochraceum]